MLALKLHCSFLSGSPPNSAAPRFANRLQMLPKQRVEGSNPFSRSNFAPPVGGKTSCGPPILMMQTS